MVVVFCIHPPTKKTQEQASVAWNSISLMFLFQAVQSPSDSIWGFHGCSVGLTGCFQGRRNGHYGFDSESFGHSQDIPDPGQL